MDPVADLNLVAEKIGEALAQIRSLPADRGLEGVEQKLLPLADQIRALAQQFHFPETDGKTPNIARPNFSEKPNERIGWLAEPGKVLNHFQDNYALDRHTLTGMIRSLLEDTVVEDTGNADPGSVSSDWDMSVGDRSVPRGRVPAAPQPIRNDKVSDDSGSVASEWDSTSDHRSDA